MFNVGGAEILVILLVALLVLGPNKLPEAARQIGRGMAQLRRMSSGFQRELREAMHDVDDESSQSAATDRSGPRPPPADTPSSEEAAPEPASRAPSNGAEESELPPPSPRTAAPGSERSGS